jgi:hypothetical protein
MILGSYTQMRRHFAAPGAATAPDGLPAWPGPALGDGTGAVDNTGASALRAGGFSGTLYAFTAGAHQFPATVVGPLVDPTKLPSGDPVWPLYVTCAAFVQDSVYGVHEYDWYVSQRRDVGRYPALGATALVEHAAQALLVTMNDPSSSSVIAIRPNAAALAVLLPGLAGAELLTASAFATLFRHCHLYARRRSDGAVQWARMYQD